MVAFRFLLLLTIFLLVFTTCFACNDDSSTSSGQADDNDENGLWRPAPQTSWQWQLSGEIDTSFDLEMYDIDLFNTAKEVIDQLHDDGRIVVCYFSAGSFEDWRPDAIDFPSQAIGDPLEDWEGEWWLDVRNETVREIMRARLDLAVEKGCDGVEPDNVDAFDNDNGFGLTAADQLDFNRFLAEQAHERGLSVGLKNDLGQVPDLLNDFDWALNEECFAYDECDELDPFIDAGKAVFHVEYVDDWSDAEALADEVCENKPQFSTLIKRWDLTAERLACD